MQQILIFCGPDMTGKTHIAYELSKRLHIPVYKASSEHKNFLSQQNNFLIDLQYVDPGRLDLIKQTGLSVIFDRGFPCEAVYSRFYKRESNDVILKYIDTEYAKLDAKIIFCTRKSFVGIADDLDSRLNTNALEKISALYEEYLTKTYCKFYKLFVDDEDLNREVGEILDFLNKSDSNNNNELENIF